MAAISSPTVASFGASKTLEYNPLKCGPNTVSFSSKGKAVIKKRVNIQASYGEYERPNVASIFFKGFMLGGLVVGALGCIYAPQISRALVGERELLLRKLPKFIYDEDKDLEKTRNILMEKIIQLNNELEKVTAKLQESEYI
ncbi:hypothetical protein LUZ60_007024 [Juncus effusus]|nr:hypothetical protein LUZ60_007024 [Juncus effusus]